jgi:GAF domain-containing protein/DNA-binding CsgD family transcriptional regulator
VTPDLLVRTLHHAIERNRQEREEARHREQLEAINHLNRVAQDVTHAVITSDARDELEQAVCDRLAGEGGYRFAWVGAVDRSLDRVEPSVAAGIEAGSLDELEISLEGGPTAEGPTGTAEGPTGTAARTREVQVVQDILEEPAYEPWREQARERGYRASAAVPIVHEELVYGVLNVYAASPRAFSTAEVDILSRLGSVIGHAIAAIERRDALAGDTVRQFEFELDGAAERLVRLSADGGTVAFENLVPTGDDLIAYGRAEGVSRDTLGEAVDLDGDIADLRVLSSEGEPYAVELVVSVLSPLVDAASAHGGRVASATIEEGAFRIVVEFPPGRDKRRQVELIEEHCPGATMVAQRTTESADVSLVDPNAVLEGLTERQRTVLETAYFSGYFEWPRVTTGEELADRLAVSPATFHQHLRTVQRQFFDAVFEGDGDA